MKQIIKLLGWSEEEYGEFIYNAGMEYLHHYIPNDEAGIDMLSRNKIFWNWWKNHWAARDEVFIQETADAPSTRALVRLYKSYHNVQNLINDIFPNAQVLGNDYCRMIGKLQDAK